MLEDKQLVEAALKGDFPSFEELVEKYRTPVFQLAYCYTGSEDEAAQITQEVFSHALLSLRAFSREKSIKTRFFKITTGLCLEKYRPNKGISFFTGSRQQVLNKTGDEVSDPLSSDQERFDHRRLEKIFNLMKLEQKYILILKDVMDLSWEEIGEIMNTSSQKAKVYVSQARMVFNHIRKEQEQL